MRNAKKAEAGMKVCPQCGTQVGIRTVRCKCGNTFEFRTSPGKRGVDVEKEALKFAFVISGGVDKAIAAVEGYIENDISKFIGVCGGKMEAIEELKKLVK
jgi:hypothetical protein